MGSEHRSYDVQAVGDGRRDSSPPPSAAVAGAQVCIAEALRETLVEEHREHGTTYEHIAARIGGKKQHVSEMCDPLSGRALSLVKVALLGPRTAPAFLRRLAAKIEAAAGVKLDLRDAALAVSESAGSVARSVREALRDGVVTSGEAATIEAALLAAEADIAATRAAMAAARARGGR